MKFKAKVILFVILPAILFAQPFRKGVNFTGWFQPESIYRLPFKRFTKKDFENIKLLGIDVVRLPVNLHAMVDSTPDHNLNDLLFYFLDQVVDWAEELNIHLILDNHSFDPAIDTDFRIDTILIPVWRQMAEHYKNRSDLIYYEILNEPHGISQSRWNEIQKNVINEIRKIDTVHTIIVGDADWNGFRKLKYLADFADTNLIYTFHFYEPTLFTHQGADWTLPSMEAVADIPFPYSPSEMPPLDNSYFGTWIEDAYNNYFYEGTIRNIDSLLNIAVEFKNSRNVKLYCGEFGVYMPNSDNEDRIFWYNHVRNYLEQNNIPWTSWDYKDGFGLFENGSDELFDYDLNIPLLEALGFNTVPQKEFTRQPDSSAIPIYTEYVETNIREASYSTSKELNFYSTEDPAVGDFCMYWSGDKQYEYIGFDFIPNRDFSFLADNDFIFSFWFKCGTPGADFNVRFVDTKEESIPDDHPWRMVYKIDDSVVDFDGAWHKVEIPLKDFWEEGSWDNGWYEPEGKFDWKAIDEFNIVAEYKDLTGAGFWFDDIKIYNPNFVAVNESEIKNGFYLYQNYPNPFNPSTTITYRIPTSETFHATSQQLVQLKVYVVLGREVKTLVNEKQNPGIHSVIYNANNLSSGVYFYKLIVNGNVKTNKMLLIK